MLFPKISDLPPVTTSLIIINGLVFAYGIITGTQDRIIANYGFIPNYLFYGNHPFSDNITRLFSSMFLHAGIAGALLHGTVYTLAIGNGSGVLIGASGAISGVMGITAALGNIRGYYWLAIQILYAFIGSVVSIPIAFTAHVGGFLTGLLLTKLLIAIERKRRGQYLY